MKILYIVSGINSFGGIESFCRNIIPLIDFERYKIDILITQDEPVGEMDKLFSDKGSDIFRLDGSGNTFERARKKKEFFKNLSVDYDVVHIHTVLTTAYYFAKLVKKYTKAKIVVHSHTASNYEGAFLKNTLCRGLLNKYTDYKLACSKNAAAFLFGNKKCADAEIIYNPVNIDKFRFNEMARTQIRESLGIDKECLVLLNVGRLTPAKNHPFLLEIFSLLRKDVANVKLLLCGDGEKRAEIEAQIKEKQLSDDVILLGNRSDVGDVMSASDCFVFPSLYEGLPTVLVEAQINGLKIVYSEKITDEVIVDEKAQKLNIEDAGEWSRQLLQYADYTNREEVNENTFAKASELFGSKFIAIKLQEFYAKIG